MKRRKSQLLAVATLSLTSTALLPACEKNPEQALTHIESDWIHDDTPSKTSPSPTPSPSPTESPPPDPSTTDYYNGPASVAPYVQKFIDDAILQGVDVTPDMSGPKLTIQIASLDAYGSGVIGLCETGGGLRRVTFDPDFWNTQSETQREILAHHEFGHCVLYRGHRSTVLSSGAYASVMYPIIMSSSTYTGNYDYYQQELFTQSASNIDPQQIHTHVCD